MTRSQKQIIVQVRIQFPLATSSNGV